MDVSWPDKSVSIYLWFRIILQKYGKGAQYFDRHCLTKKSIFLRIGGAFQHNFPLFTEKSPFWSILTQKSQHKPYYLTNVSFSGIGETYLLNIWIYRVIIPNTRWIITSKEGIRIFSLNIRSKFLNSVLFSTKSALFVFSDSLKKKHFFKNRRCISTQFAIIYRKISHFVPF